MYAGSTLPARFISAGGPRGYTSVGLYWRTARLPRSLVTPDIVGRALLVVPLVFGLNLHESASVALTLLTCVHILRLAVVDAILSCRCGQLEQLNQRLHPLHLIVLWDLKHRHDVCTLRHTLMPFRTVHSCESEQLNRRLDPLHLLPLRPQALAHLCGPCNIH